MISHTNVLNWNESLLLISSIKLKKLKLPTITYVVVLGNAIT